MSGILVGRVWALDLSHTTAWVLMAMCDHGDDFGDNIWPSVAYLSWKTNYSPRQIQRVLQELRDRGIAIPRDPLTGGRHRSVEYHINLDAAPMKPEYQGRRGKYDTVPPFRDSVTSDAERNHDKNDVNYDKSMQNHDTVMAYNPSIEPSIEPSESSMPANWFEILGSDPRWPSTSVVDPYVRGVEEKYPNREMLAYEAHLAYEWLQTTPGKRKKRLRAFWNNWLRNKDRPPQATRPDAATRTEKLPTTAELKEGWANVSGNGESRERPTTPHG